MNQGVSHVEAETAEASRSGEALQDILRQISAVAMMVHRIAEAAAGSQLHGNADVLQRLIGTFKLQSNYI